MPTTAPRATCADGKSPRWGRGSAEREGKLALGRQAERADRRSQDERPGNVPGGWRGLLKPEKSWRGPREVPRSCSFELKDALVCRPDPPSHPEGEEVRDQIEHPRETRLPSTGRGGGNVGLGQHAQPPLRARARRRLHCCSEGRTHIAPLWARANNSRNVTCRLGLRHLRAAG